MEVLLLICETGLFGRMSELSKITSIKSEFACVISATVVASSKTAGTGPVAYRLGPLLSVSDHQHLLLCVLPFLSVIKFGDLPPMNQT